MTATPNGMRTVTTRSALSEELEGIRERGETLALVPTMGALHEGHLSLVDRGVQKADRTALTIFVNPLQFAPQEDLDRYPRTLERDLELVAERGTTLIFAPSTEVMYPGGPPTVRVTPGPLGGRLCGASRPGHFEGVLTVVARLFGLFRPDVAVFGRKDLQQAVLIRRMVRDLELDVEIEVAPLVREWDGLALSSRNAYLTAAERIQALGLSRAGDAADQAFRDGEKDAGALEDRARQVLAAHPGVRVDYVSVVDPEGLDPVREAGVGDVLALAAHVGVTRLIDNRVLGAVEADPRVPRPG